MFFKDYLKGLIDESKCKNRGNVYEQLNIQ